MVELIWTGPALENIDQIADHIAIDKPEAARKLVARLFEKAELLKQFPKLGTCPPELKGMTYRQIIVSPCRVFYKIDSKRIYILHVIRGEQLLNQTVFKN
jgi:toxin ParE1/3/4